MSEDTFTEVTHESWGSRIVGSIKGIGLGIGLIIGCVILLFWNEGRAVKRAKGLKEGAENVVTIKTDQVLSSHEGKLIHLTGIAETEQILTDPVFNISQEGIH